MEGFRDERVKTTARVEGAPCETRHRRERPGPLSRAPCQGRLSTAPSQHVLNPVISAGTG